MKLKMVVVDLEIPSRVKRWGLGLGIPLAGLIFGGVAFAGTIPQFTSGQELTAAALNAMVNELNTLSASVGTLQTTVSSQEAEIGGPGVAVSLQDQIQMLAEQVVSTPTYVGSSQDFLNLEASSAAQLVPALSFSITPSAPSVSCVVTTVCQVPATATGGGTTLDIALSANGGAFGNIALIAGAFPTVSEGNTTATVTAGFMATGGLTYTFASSIQGNGLSAAALVGCSLTATCGSAAGPGPT